MSKSRPFTYNTGSLIPGTEKFGNLTVGIPESGFESTGLQWWNGPDEDLGYIIASTNVDINGNGLQPTPVGILGNVGFNRTKTWMYSDFVGLVNTRFNQNFVTASVAKTWLESNGKWTSFIDSTENTINNFIDRVKYNGGLVESESSLSSSVIEIGEDLFNQASLVITPNGYEEDLLFSLKPTNGSGDMFVTRATTGTRVNEQGLIEVVPYNLVGYSQEFENTYWFKTSGVVTVVQNVTTAPDGTLTADQIKTTLSNGELRTANTITAINGQQYTWSAYVKSAGSRYCSLTAWNADDPYTIFDLTNISIVNEYGPAHTSTITDIGNGWRRITITRTISTTYNFLWFRFSPNSYLQPNTEGVYLWGAQIVNGPLPKDYFPTTTRFNVPRLDYSNGSCPSILVEPQRTNLLSRSEEFENASWGKTNASVISNSIISPSGLMDADKLVEDNLLAHHNIRVYTGGTELRTNSIFVKAGERSRFILWAGASGYMFDLINLTTTPGNNASSITNASIQDYGNGWYRCSITTNALTNNGYTISLLDNETNPQTPFPQYQGDGVSGLYIWGAQRENASSLTSYIPTTTGSVTRNADVISNTNAYNLIGQTEGTIYIDANLQGQSFSDNVSKVLCEINLNNTVQNRITIYRYNNLLYYDNIVNGAYQGGTNFFTITDFIGEIKIALTYQQNNVKVFVNGVLRNTDTSALIPECNTFSIGSARYTNTVQWNGTINNALLWKTQLTDEEAINLTTL